MHAAISLPADEFEARGLARVQEGAEALGLKYRTYYVSGKIIKGIAIPRKQIEGKLLGAEDLLTKYEDTVERLIVEGKLEPSEDTVVKYLVERGVEKETARYMFKLLTSEKPLLFSKK